jgi:hypothetical protein
MKDNLIFRVYISNNNSDPEVHDMHLIQQYYYTIAPSLR